jgi:hypothetical protein
MIDADMMANYCHEDIMRHHQVVLKIIHFICDELPLLIAVCIASASEDERL